MYAGNWKMNFLPEDAAKNAAEFRNKIQTMNAAEIVLCVPYVSLKPVMNALEGSVIKVGAQNMHYEEKGAFTGEISGEMLKAMGVTHVLIGHSERRQYFGETDESVNLKVLKALELDITPILCVGESQEQRNLNITNEVLRLQVNHALQKVYTKDMERVVIAYEPIWAIGTGEVAEPKDAEKACKYIRTVIKNKYGDNIANNTTILYGGSVDENNASDLFAELNIDGGLVGGASMKPSFSKLINNGIRASTTKGDDYY